MNESAKIGFQDLLFNSAVACILLFIIFSLKVGGKSLANSDVDEIGINSSAGNDINLPIPSEKIKGKMTSIKIVEIAELSTKELNNYKEKFRKNNQGFEWTNIDDKKDQRVIFFKNKIQFLGYHINDQNNIEFKLTDPVFQNGVIRTAIIEASSLLTNKKDKFNGYKAYNENFTCTSESIRVEFNIKDQNELVTKKPFIDCK
ncbi:hypothetical protein IMCC3317_17770 [Kordia antarctica]|uniref:Uncharacterized protein n=1 Tax=Kordia antarctica TaxID=1218801 RepID=A0A7L4ZKG6_9FLAO|nr:hypothetical protein [Kordia antarctica]QHI36414.1 hypothetical protein IMCC3317_17770 [Kordia antarctica]